ncbi:MAG: hypothetical protein WKF68_03790 [Daejeonella sp.]
MARSKFNVLTHGLSGLVGDMIVFRQRANKTIVCGKPRPSSKAPTASALAIRERFKRSSHYAASAMENTMLKAEYQLTAKLGQSAYNMAFSDYQKAPEIYQDIVLDGYTGVVGETIEVSVLDDFRVQSVHVKVASADGTLIEQGEAVQTPNGLDWAYTFTAANSEVTGSKLTITAMDLPGNKTVLEKILV